MGVNTGIQWADHTFNPWRGCTKVSAECANCYAETQSGRNPGVLGVWGKNGTRVIASESMWHQPVKWNRWAAEGKCRVCGGSGRGRGPSGGGNPVPCDGCGGTGLNGEGQPYRAKVFCASLADVFEAVETMPADAVESVALARRRLFRLIFDTPHLDWMLLTKRPENIRPTLREDSIWLSDRDDKDLGELLSAWHFSAWIPPNVHLGTSVGDQKQANIRIPYLLACPAAIRFLSMEPLLGSVDITRFLYATGVSANGPWRYPSGRTEYMVGDVGPDTINRKPAGEINGVIVGGESGPGARPMHPNWARSLRDQCVEAQTPYFFKQWGEYGPYEDHHLQISDLDERTTLVAHDGEFTNTNKSRRGKWSSPRDGIDKHCAVMARVGKRAAGRLLDGREWNEWPTLAGLEGALTR